MRNIRPSISWAALCAVTAAALFGAVACASPPTLPGGYDAVATLKVDTKDAVMKLAVSPNGKWVAATLFLDRKNVIVWDVTEQKIAYRLPHNNAGKEAIAFTPDGKYLITGDGLTEGDLAVRDQTGAFLLDERGNPKYREPTADEKFVGHLWDIATGKKIKTFRYVNRASTCGLNDIKFFGDESQYAINLGNALLICSSTTAQLIQKISYPWIEKKSSRVRLGSVLQVAMHSDRKRVYLATERYFSSDNAQREYSEASLIWFDVEGTQAIKEVAVTPRWPKPKIGFGFLLNPIAISSDGRIIAVSSWYSKEDVPEPNGKRQRITTLDSETGRIITVIDSPALQLGVSAIQIGADGRLLFTAGEKVIAWDISSGKKLGEFEDILFGKRRRFSDVRISNDGRTLVAGGGDAAYVWSSRQ